jgi:hypothetical protein
MSVDARSVLERHPHSTERPLSEGGEFWGGHAAIGVASSFAAELGTPILVTTLLRHPLAARRSHTQVHDIHLGPEATTTKATKDGKA